jgi:hypothetical protein
MKPLVLWCRWNNARLRLHGRNETEVWGEIVLPDSLEQFRYNIAAAELRLGKENPWRYIKLDDMGIDITVI